MKFHGSVTQNLTRKRSLRCSKRSTLRYSSDREGHETVTHLLQLWTIAGSNSRQGCDVPSTLNNCRSLCFERTSAAKELKLISAIPQSWRLKVNELVKLLVSTVAGVNAICGSLHYETWGRWNEFQQPIINFKCIKLSSYR